MIKHIVLLTFKSTVTSSQIHEVFTQLADLQKVIPAIKHFSFGENCSPENLNKGFQHGFIMEFDDAQGRDAYLEHPAHVNLAQNLIIPLLEDSLESALVFDYTC